MDGGVCYVGTVFCLCAQRDMVLTTEEVPLRVGDNDDGSERRNGGATWNDVNSVNSTVVVANHFQNSDTAAAAAAHLRSKVNAVVVISVCKLYHKLQTFISLYYAGQEILLSAY